MTTADNEMPDECMGCEYPTANLTFYAAEYAGPSKYPTRRSAWLCDLCAATASGQAAVSTRTDNVYHEMKPITSTICYVGNAIIAKMSELGHKRIRVILRVEKAILAELRKHGSDA